jgi:hypothetical protein
MSIMRVLVVELLYQAVMGRIPVLECLMPEVCRCLWLCLSCLALNVIAIQGPQLLGHLSGT